MLIKKDLDTIRSYFEDSSNLKGGYAEKVILPETIDELAAAVKDANSKMTPVTISGGGTGTTGSRIPFGGVVISMEKFNKIIGVSDKDMSAAIQAGALVEDLKRESEAKGLFYTSHPTEKAASVGGTVATNASGARSFKYGPTRKYVKRLKVVLSNGDILDVKRGDRVLAQNDARIKLPSGFEINVPMPSYKMPLVKNSAGYFARDRMDLIDLFIGQEGTLSIIAEIELALVKKPSAILSCFVFFIYKEDAWNFSDEVKRLSRNNIELAGSPFDVLSVEYFDSNALRLLRDKNPNVPRNANAAIFFEQETEGQKEDALMDRWLKLILKHNAAIDDTWVAMNEKESDEFTKFRYAIPESVNDIIRRNGFQKISTDIAVPDDKFFEMMSYYTQVFIGVELDHVIFGHIGENHLHANLLPRSETELKKAKEIALDFVRKGVSLGGTVSAEHGIGKIKHGYLEEMYGARGVLEMARIKKAFDPNWILGLDNIFPRDISELL